ncbi:hypothetical protein [Mycoplasma phocoeninasale]|uniref:Uncharacterized protein n=1 Tax=Mycoplasma phocoeninasale TaxID=2726117 RepID=A0A858U5V4_9MOLU|nr:hypothetical protein [Mycoplasma phocoeninasale]MBN0970834.1 hypothetical protein [Mycoplasma phocoeninasale]QJG66126.1 hypothetical protein HGG64_00045 [Mycoplasma phocoeninasale]
MENKTWRIKSEKSKKNFKKYRKIIKEIENYFQVEKLNNSEIFDDSYIKYFEDSNLDLSGNTNNSNKLIKNYEINSQISAIKAIKANLSKEIEKLNLDYNENKFKIDDKLKKILEK